VLAIFATLPADAAPPNQLTPEESKAGWTLLFDGKKAAGWRAWNDDRFPANGWVVRDDCLQCLASNGRPNGGGGDIVTRKQFKNFEFRWEWRASPGCNSGVIYFLRRRDQPDPQTGLIVYGHEYQLLDDDGEEFAKVPPNRKAGSLYGVIPASGKTLRPVGEFNSSRLVVRKNRVEHWLNEKKVVDYELKSPAFEAQMKKSKYARLPGYGKKIPTALLLQDHGHAIAFRNLKIRELEDD
jgi:hypothetical protein